MKADAMPASLVIAVALALMLLMFCLRIWDFGIVHTDDAIWALHAWKGDWGIVWRWATEQGRVWALVSGSILLAALKIKGSLVGDLAIIATFVAFFLAFHVVIAAYFGRGLAMLVAALNLGLWSLRWEGNVLTTYPAFTWLLGIAFVASLFAARRYLANGNPLVLAGSLFLLLLALCVHEGVSVLFATLYPLAVLADARALGPRAHRTRPDRTVLLGYAGVVLFYFLAYFGWRFAYPSGYTGNSLAPFDGLRIARVAAAFALSGSLPFDVLFSYEVGFANPSSGEASRIVYRLGDYLLAASSSPGALAFGGLAWFVCWQALRSLGPSLAGARAAAAAIGVGALIALVPILPVAMTVKYQQWHFDYEIQSYVHTGLSHFGVALVIGGCIVLAARVFATWRLQSGFAFSASALVAALAAGGFTMNEGIAADMRSEANRWRVLGRAVEMLAADGGANSVMLVAPRFASGSWFTVLPASYWSEWAKLRHGVDVTLSAGPLPASDGAGRVYVLDYRETLTRMPTVFAARVKIDASTSTPVVDRILLAPSERDPEALEEFLVFREVHGGPQVMRVAAIPLAAGTNAVRILDNVAADPGSIRVQREFPMPALAVQCPQVLDQGRRAGFGTSPAEADCVLTAALLDGWHAPERNGVWSKARVATISVRVAASPDSADPVIRLALKSYPGLGFYPGKTTIRVRSGEIVLTDFEDAKGTPAVSEFAVPRRAVGSNGLLKLSIESDRVYNPKALGVAADTRDLGVHLRSLELIPSRPRAGSVEAKPATRHTSEAEPTPRVLR